MVEKEGERRKKKEEMREKKAYSEISDDDGPAVGVENVLSLGILAEVDSLTTGSGGVHGVDALYPI